MTEPVTIALPGRPVPWARAGKNGKRQYTPAQQAAAMLHLKLKAREEMRGRPPMGGALMVNALFQYGIPKSWPKADRERAMLGQSFPTGKPDVDNLVKLIADSLSGVVFNDDAQIVGLQAQKAYGPEALTVVTVRPLA